jgi:hypothetical protein
VPDRERRGELQGDLSPAGAGLAPRRASPVLPIKSSRPANSFA